MKNKKLLQHDKVILDKLHTDAEKILSRSINDDMYVGQSDLHTFFSQLKINLLKLELQNQKLMAANMSLDQKRADIIRIHNLAAVGYIMLDEAGLVQEINNIGLNMLHTSISAVTGRDFSRYISPEFSAKYRQFFKQMLQTQTRQSVKLKFVSKADDKFIFRLDGIGIPPPGNGFTRYHLALVDISDINKVEDENEALKQQLQKNIALTAVTAQENERKRISTALHDSIGQLLYGIKMQVDLLNQDTPSPMVEKIYQLLETAVTETRNMAFELAPSILTDFGLPETINELTQRLTTPHLQIKTRISGFKQRMDINLELCIFRIVQELVNNCIKHAAASLIQLSLTRAKNIVIVVRDNGSGFKPQTEVSPKGSGINSIKNRILLYKGTLDIQSEQKQGTTVTITLQH